MYSLLFSINSPFNHSFPTLEVIFLFILPLFLVNAVICCSFGMVRMVCMVLVICCLKLLIIIWLDRDTLYFHYWHILMYSVFPVLNHERLLTHVHTLVFEFACFVCKKNLPIICYYVCLFYFQLKKGAVLP